MIDPTRYAFITNEYRREYVRDTTIATRYKKARVLDLDTNMVGPVTTMLTAMFAVIGAVRRRFEVFVAGTDIFDLDMLAGATLGITLNAPEHEANNLLCIVTRMIIDEDEDQTILEVWG
jgi:hypothetical protein